MVFPFEPQLLPFIAASSFYHTIVVRTTQPRPFASAQISHFVQLLTSSPCIIAQDCSPVDEAQCGQQPQVIWENGCVQEEAQPGSASATGAEEGHEEIYAGFPGGGEGHTKGWVICMLQVHDVDEGLDQWAGCVILEWSMFID